MSVGLFVEFQSDRRDLYVPIATEEVYSKYWIGTGERLGLRWIPLFDTGFVLEKEDVLEVLEELVYLRMAFEARNDKMKHFLLYRLDFLVSKLSTLDWSDVEEVYIG